MTLKRGKHSKYLPFVFTEYGVLMLSSVLRSKRATRVNIRIMRLFAKMNQVLLTDKDILLKLEKLERKSEEHDKHFEIVYDAVKKLLTDPKPPKRKRIGFRIENDKR